MPHAGMRPGGRRGPGPRAPLEDPARVHSSTCDTSEYGTVCAERHATIVAIPCPALSPFGKLREVVHVALGFSSAAAMAAAKASVPKMLTSAEQEKLASRTGARRTVYYTKQVSKDAGGDYARTHHYLGEWKNNKCGVWDPTHAGSCAARPQLTQLFDPRPVVQVGGQGHAREGRR